MVSLSFLSKKDVMNWMGA